MIMEKLILRLFFFGIFMPWIVAAESDANNQQQQQQEQQQQLSQPQQQVQPKKLSSPQFSAPYLNSIHSDSDPNGPFKPINHIYSTPIYSSPQPTLQIKEPSLRAQPSATIQTGFQPLSVPTGPTPVIMQYLPQNQLTGGVQYLQLIPTRPLIVPISPYITPIQQNHSPNSAGIPDFTPKNTISTAASEQSTVSSALPSYTFYSPSHSGSNIRVIGAYSSPVPTYKFFRPNGGMEIISPPQDLTLNTNEFLPAPNDAPTLTRIARARS